MNLKPMTAVLGTCISQNGPFALIFRVILKIRNKNFLKDFAKKPMSYTLFRNRLLERHNKVPGYPLGGWVRSSFAILLVPLCTRTPNTAKSSAA